MKGVKATIDVDRERLVLLLKEAAYFLDERSQTEEGLGLGWGGHVRDWQRATAAALKQEKQRKRKAGR